jgi:hypothetical protein
MSTKVIPPEREVADLVPGPSRDCNGRTKETERDDVREGFHERLRLRGGLSTTVAAPARDAIEGSRAARTVRRRISWVADGWYAASRARPS